MHEITKPKSSLPEVYTELNVHAIGRVSTEAFTGHLYFTSSELKDEKGYIKGVPIRSNLENWFATHLKTPHIIAEWE
jgi:hypothetical protein